MKPDKQKKLEKAGWKVGSSDEFLALSPEEAIYIEVKLALCDSIKSRRIEKRLSQTEFAELISSSQSRVAKLEAGDPSVSIDLAMKSLLKLGATKKIWQSSFTGRYSARISLCNRPANSVQRSVMNTVEHTHKLQLITARFKALFMRFTRKVPLRSWL